LKIKKIKKLRKIIRELEENQRKKIIMHEELKKGRGGRRTMISRDSRHLF